MADWFEAYAEILFDQFLPDGPLRVLQIGVFEGDATRWLLDNRDIEIIVDVDPWPRPEVEASYDRNILDRRVVKERTTSDEFFQANTRTFNFVYVDGDHTVEQVYRDGINGWACLEPDGILAFDDYEWERGVLKAGIDRVIAGIDGELLTVGWQLWVRK